MTTISLASLPAIGAQLEGGVFAGLTTTKGGAHCAVVLLDAQPGKRLPWAGAMEWAASVGGELPARPVSALLYAHLKSSHFADGGWYWTSEQHEDDGAYAWFQYFNYGGLHDCTLTSYEGRVRAVRLIPISGACEPFPEPATGWKVGNEFQPFHPDASHAPPEWRDGWNACYRAAAKFIVADRAARSAKGE